MEFYLKIDQSPKQLYWIPTVNSPRKNFHSTFQIKFWGCNFLEIFLILCEFSTIALFCNYFSIWTMFFHSMRHNLFPCTYKATHWVAAKRPKSFQWHAWSSICMLLNVIHASMQTAETYRRRLLFVTNWTEILQLIIEMVVQIVKTRRHIWNLEKYYAWNLYLTFDIRWSFVLKKINKISERDIGYDSTTIFYSCFNLELQNDLTVERARWLLLTAQRAAIPVNYASAVSMDELDSMKESFFLFPLSHFSPFLIDLNR